jgi:hypothetical protein
MAFSKSDRRGGEKGKSLVDMTRKPTSSLSGNLEIRLSDESQDEIVERSHDLGGTADSHASGIFSQGDIAAVAQTCLNAPMSAPNIQQGQGSGFLAR